MSGSHEILSSFHELYLSARTYLFKFISPRSFRLLLVLSVYLIIRPYLLNHGAKRQAEEHDKVVHGEKAKPTIHETSRTTRGSTGEPNPRIVELEDSDSDEELSRKDGGKARRRQNRRTMQEIIEDKSRMADNTDSDKEVEDLLRRSVQAGDAVEKASL